MAHIRFTRRRFYILWDSSGERNDFEPDMKVVKGNENLVAIGLFHENSFGVK